MKTCSKCKELKPLDGFHKDSYHKDGHRSVCKQCISIQANLRYYSVSKPSMELFLRRSYNNIKQRSRRHHRVLDFKVDPFLAWALNDPIFQRLFQTWKESGYLTRLSPSPDRIDNLRGYELENLQWLSCSDNASKGNGQRVNKFKGTYFDVSCRKYRACYYIGYKTIYLGTYSSQEDAYKAVVEYAKSKGKVES